MEYDVDHSEEEAYPTSEDEDDRNSDSSKEEHEGSQVCLSWVRALSAPPWLPLHKFYVLTIISQTLTEICTSEILELQGKCVFFKGLMS